MWVRVCFVSVCVLGSTFWCLHQPAGLLVKILVFGFGFWVKMYLGFRIAVLVPGSICWDICLLCSGYKFIFCISVYGPWYSLLNKKYLIFLMHNDFTIWYCSIFD